MRPAQAHVSFRLLLYHSFPAPFGSIVSFQSFSEPEYSRVKQAEKPSPLPSSQPQRLWHGDRDMSVDL